MGIIKTAEGLVLFFGKYEAGVTWSLLMWGGLIITYIIGFFVARMIGQSEKDGDVSNFLSAGSFIFSPILVPLFLILILFHMMGSLINGKWVNPFTGGK